MHKSGGLILAIFIEKKIPKEKRDKYPLLTDANNNILWIPNLKKSKYISKKDEIYDIILTSSKKEENKWKKRTTWKI